MSKVDDYLIALKRREDWTSYLSAESGLPGPRANIELAQAVAMAGKQELFDGFLTLGPIEAPANTPEEFLVLCGVLGIGRLEAEGKLYALKRLRILASDPRRRVREAVVMALQTIGRADREKLFAVANKWSKGSPLEQRAAVAGICEPDLLKHESTVRKALFLLDAVTKSYMRRGDRKADDVRMLREALGCCWSVAVAADPDAGFPCLEDLLNKDDPDLRWIVAQNLKRNCLERTDPERTERLRKRVRD